MTEHEHDGPGRELDALLTAARAELDRRRELDPPLPDFAAMLERARELDPDAVDADTLAQARSFAPVVPMRARPEVGPEIEPFTAALRAELDLGLAEHRARQIPPPAFLARPRPRRLVRRSWSWAAGLALLLLGGAVSAMVGVDRWLAPQDPDDDAPVVEERVESQTARAPGEGRARPELDAAPPVEAQPEPAQPERAQPELHAAEPGAEAVAQREPSSRRRRAPRREPQLDPVVEPVVDPLAQLDLDAQARWREGDLDGAEALFEEIVRRGGRGRWAELAYAELFALAQRHPASVREQRWRAYLVGFPKGRYAEDARAGLCRSASEVERQACWTEYLEQHPQGTHASEARTALGE